MPRVLPRPRQALSALLCLAGLLAPGAPRAGELAGSEHYGFSARLRLASQVGHDRLEYQGGALGLPVGEGTVEVGRQALSAHGVVLARLFQPGGTPPALDLEVRVTEARLTMGGLAGTAVVAHEVVARDAAGAEVARWEVRGEEQVVGYDSRAVAAAFARAARQAANAFEEAFDRSPPVGAWLSAQGLARRAPPQSPERFAVRTGSVVFLDGGAGTTSGGRRAVSLRGGLSGERLLVAMRVASAAVSFDADPAFGDASGPAGLEATAAGVELGVVHRAFRILEAQAGLGLHAVRAAAALDYSPGGYLETRHHTVEKWAMGGSAFLQVGCAAGSVTPLRLRIRIGVEGRVNFGGSLRFEVYRATVQVPPATLLVTLGTEFPAR